MKEAQKLQARWSSSRRRRAIRRSRRRRAAHGHGEANDGRRSCRQDRPGGHQSRRRPDARRPRDRGLQRGPPEVARASPSEMSKLRQGSRSPARYVMAYYPEPVARLIEALQRLPASTQDGQALVLFLLKRPVDEVAALAGRSPSSRPSSSSARCASTSRRGSLPHLLRPPARCPLALHRRGAE